MFTCYILHYSITNEELILIDFYRTFIEQWKFNFIHIITANQENEFPLRMSSEFVVNLQEYNGRVIWSTMQKPYNDI